MYVDTGVPQRRLAGEKCGSSLSQLLLPSPAEWELKGKREFIAAVELLPDCPAPGAAAGCVAKLLTVLMGQPADKEKHLLMTAFGHVA